MEDSFILSFEYKERNYNLESKFFRTGYIHQFHINIEGSTLIVEFDEERNYRVINTGISSTKNIEVGLLEAIVNKVSSFH